MSDRPETKRPALSGVLEDTGAEDASELKRQSVQGGAFTLASQGGSVVLQLISTVVLARLLGPEAYGVLAMVNAVTAFAGIFRDLGLSTSTIQQATLTHGQLSAMFWINVTAGAILTAVVAACAPLVAWFYGRPELNGVTRLLSLTFVISSFGAQHGALLARRMRFGRQMAATLSGALISLVVAVALATQGFGYWSLVGSTLSGGLTTTILLSVLSGWRPGLPVRGGLRSMLRFGANITAFEFVNYFSRNLDSILIGRVWGPAALGLYSRAYQLLMFPIINLRGPVVAVALPAMSRLQNQPAAYRSYYRVVVSVLATLTMPLTAFLFVTSDAVIALALGERWSKVSPIFSLLAVTAFVQPAASLTGLVCLSLGMGRRYLWLGITNAVLFSAGFLIGVQWGPQGVAGAYAIVTYLGLLPNTAWAFHGTPLRTADFVDGTVRAAAASLISGLCVGLLRLSVPGLGPWATLLGGLPVFLVLYLGTFLALPGGRAEMARGVRMLRALRWPAP
jgi:polysaccharide transporter, PST family